MRVFGAKGALIGRRVELRPTWTFDCWEVRCDGGGVGLIGGGEFDRWGRKCDGWEGCDWGKKGVMGGI